MTARISDKSMARRTVGSRALGLLASNAERARMSRRLNTQRMLFRTRKVVHHGGREGVRHGNNSDEIVSAMWWGSQDRHVAFDV